MTTNVGLTGESLCRMSSLCREAAAAMVEVCASMSALTDTRKRRSYDNRYTKRANLKSRW